MPEVNIEKKTDFPWWLFLLGVLLVGALIWWALAQSTERRVAEIPVADPNTAVVVPDTNTVTNAEDNEAGTDRETFTNILSIVDAENPQSLIGRKVILKGAPVQLTGATAFWIGPSVQQKMLVDAGDATMGSGLTTVAQRQRLNIEGEIREITNMDEAKAKWKLDDSAITTLTNQKIYLHATNIELDKQ